MRTIGFIALLLVFSSCESSHADKTVKISGQATRENKSVSEAEAPLSGKSGYSKVIGDVEYAFQVFTATDYLEKIGQKAEKQDLESLKKESVLVISFTDTKAADLYEKSALDKNDLQLYLTGSIANDINVEQSGSRIEILGCQVLGNGSRTDRLGVIFFMKGLDINRKFTGLYYDQLFNGGLIRIPSTKL